jgi:hypothetical protein
VREVAPEGEIGLVCLKNQISAAGSRLIAEKRTEPPEK